MPYSLDQFQVFIAVVDTGGFAAAARKLNRAQSAITYAIRGLEEACGLVLFDRSSYRPTLTTAGQTLLPRARQLVSDLQDYQRQADNFAKGVEASLTIAMDLLSPLEPLLQTLTALRNTFPDTQINLVRSNMRSIKERLKENTVQIGIFAPITPIGNEFETQPWTEHELVAVASPSHPLAQQPGMLKLEDVRQHMQIVWQMNEEKGEAGDLGIHALDNWHVNDLNSKLQCLRAGLGWGSMPDHWVSQDLAAGTLIKLSLESWEGNQSMPTYTTLIARHTRGQHGPVSRWLIRKLGESICYPK